jgi:4a-hydroxytetrahydrobiopterin dehydratase
MTSLRRVGALSSEQLNVALQQLPGWKAQTLEASKKEVIAKEFVFADFKQAWAFMGSLYTFIDTTDHHPEWSNVYNRVNVMLTTHDVGNKVSEKDIKLAQQMEAASKKL